uniref:N_BRCA1_IG domain-containing protein n=1 Tax=Trichuris muris TaxID=70415 RepID=A0A5S6QTL3_TRIMR
MDIDADVDGKLAQQLGCLGTSDREVLIQRFADIVGSQNTTPQVCRLMLDMNNWNLQNALGCYYDYRMADQLAIPSMTFVKDVTIGEGESVPPNTTFVKVWRICNNGAHQWPAGCRLHFISGELLTETNWVEVEPLGAGEVGDVSIKMVSPPKTGFYESLWQMQTQAGYPFGETIWCIIAVEDSGLLGLTQMMAQTTCFDAEMGEFQVDDRVEDSEKCNSNEQTLNAGTFQARELFARDESQFPSNVVPRDINLPGESAETMHTLPSHNICGSSRTFAARSMPIPIASQGAIDDVDQCEVPIVPPCTPSSPVDSLSYRRPIDPKAVREHFGEHMDEFDL